ncbi:hypothetical protein P9Z94_25030 [Bacillus thuringiensis]|uniref:hypothetical protein n=1 Tax=Bacillus thuringiensis TaxID=1428 RepID=UPI002DB9DD0B|nr:hypothetical protein [Bacillus thuringiensis]MEC3159313.1 hypothetical protein [Bacillus thuringiensis]
MESITKIIANLERSVNDLQRDNDGLKQTLLHVSTTVEALNRKIDMLEKGLTTKAGMTHVREIVKESIVEHTADSIQGRVVKGSEIK